MFNCLFFLLFVVILAEVSEYKINFFLKIRKILKMQFASLVEGCCASLQC